MERLKDKVCIITGAASGLGYSIAEKFAIEDAKIVVLDFDEAGGIKATEELIANGAEAIFVKADVTKSDDWANVVKKVLEKYGKIDVLVNNTGIFKAGDALEMGEDMFKKILDVNMNGVYLGMQAVLDPMVKQGSGSIINISSEAGLVAIPNQVAYNTSKAAVIMMTKSVAVDFATRGIRANVLAPGRMHTALVERLLNEADSYEDEYKRLASDRPLMRMGKPEEVAMGAVFLASDESHYCTGSVLSIDGAYSCAQYNK